MINLELYKIFVVVANEQSIIKASNTLHISQLTITKQIKSLEKLLGFKLFKKINAGLVLTEIGNELYQKLKSPINEIMYIDNQFSSIKNINIGSHSNLLNKIFGDCLNQFYLEYPKVNLNFRSLATDEMLQMLTNKNLDIVFSKKLINKQDPNINFIKLGYLNDIFIVNKDSDLANKVLTKSDLKSEIIYAPKTYSQTVNRLLSFIDIQELNLKCSSYSTILDLVSSSSSIGILTEEYLNKGALKKHNLIPVDTELNLDPVEFGIYYLNNNRFQELNDLIQVIKSYFFFKDF